MNTTRKVILPLEAVAPARAGGSVNIVRFAVHGPTMRK
jgi:hypothetical protein